MIVTIFGATGMVGKELLVHAMAKGWTVRAFGRNVEHLIDEDTRLKELHVIKGYVFDEEDVRKAISGSDAVLSALGGAFDGTDKARSLGLKNIATQMEALGVKRLVALGGFGVLPGPDGDFILNGQDYPEQYLPVGREHLQAYLNIKDRNLDWTFVCSPNIIPGHANNNFTTVAEAPAPNMEISAGNLAIFMVNELERNQYIRQRVGISNT